MVGLIQCLQQFCSPAPCSVLHTCWADITPSRSCLFSVRKQTAAILLSAPEFATAEWCCAGYQCTASGYKPQQHTYMDACCRLLLQQPQIALLCPFPKHRTCGALLLSPALLLLNLQSFPCCICSRVAFVTSITAWSTLYHPFCLLLVLCWTWDSTIHTTCLFLA